jgi:hypothetical protein
MSVYTYKNGLLVGLSINKLPVSIDFYNTGGVFSPLFGSQLTIDSKILEITTTNNSMRKIRLNFVSTPTSNKENMTGKFSIEYLSSGSWTEEDLLIDIGINHARNFSSWRRDVVHWKYETSGADTIFSIWYYNFSASKTFSGKVAEILSTSLLKTNCIHYIL